MRKLSVLFISLILTLTLVISPAFGGGGKNQGDVGQGTVDQGETGNESASPGSDAQGNQVH